VCVCVCEREGGRMGIECYLTGWLVAIERASERKEGRSSIVVVL